MENPAQLPPEYSPEARHGAPHQQFVQAPPTAQQYQQPPAVQQYAQSPPLSTQYATTPKPPAYARTSQGGEDGKTPPDTAYQPAAARFRRAPLPNHVKFGARSMMVTCSSCGRVTKTIVRRDRCSFVNWGLALFCGLWCCFLNPLSTFSNQAAFHYLSAYIHFSSLASFSVS